MRNAIEIYAGNNDFSLLRRCHRGKCERSVRFNAPRHENIRGAKARQLVVVNLEYNTVYDPRIGRESYHRRAAKTRSDGWKSQIAFTGSTRDDNARVRSTRGMRVR